MSVAPKNPNFKKGKLAIDFSTVDDLFLNNKGKSLRNKQKKLDKIKETLKAVKKGEVTPDESQMLMLAKEPELTREIAELKDLCDLYIKSYPNWNKKNEEEELAQTAEVDATAQIKEAIAIVHKLLALKDAKEHSGAQRKSLAHLQ